MSRRDLQMQRAIMKVWQEMATAGNAIAAILTKGTGVKMFLDYYFFLNQ